MLSILIRGRKRYPIDVTSYTDDNNAFVVNGFPVIVFSPSSSSLLSFRISVILVQGFFSLGVDLSFRHRGRGWFQVDKPSGWFFFFFLKGGTTLLTCHC